jgi:hypothetical protein
VTYARNGAGLLPLLLLLTSLLLLLPMTIANSMALQPHRALLLPPPQSTKGC